MAGWQNRFPRQGSGSSPSEISGTQRRTESGLACSGGGAVLPLGIITARQMFPPVLGAWWCPVGPIADFIEGIDAFGFLATSPVGESRLIGVFQHDDRCPRSATRCKVPRACCKRRPSFSLMPGVAPPKPSRMTTSNWSAGTHPRWRYRAALGLFRDRTSSVMLVSWQICVRR